MFTFIGQLVTEATVSDIDDIEADSVDSVMAKVREIMPGATLYDERDSFARWGEQADMHWHALGENLVGVVGWEGRLVGHVYSPTSK